MSILYTCKYCGRTGSGEGIAFEGKMKDLMTYLDKKRDDFSNNCVCQKESKKECKK